MARFQFFKTHLIDLLVILILGFWAICSYHNWITDSEFWPISLSGHFDLWREHVSLVYKPLFHASLAWIYSFDLSSVDHIRVAKAFYSVLGVMYFYLFYLISKRHLGSLNGFLFFLVFLFSAFGFTQVGNIRSDFLAAVVALGALYLVDRYPYLIKSFLFFLLTGLVLILVTPKSLYLIGIILIVFLLNQPKKKEIRFFNLTIATLILFLLALYFVDQYFLKFQISNSFYSAWNHNKVAYVNSSDMSAKIFVYPFFKKDFPLLVFLLLVLGSSFRSFRKEWKTITPILFSLFFIVGHKPQLPFFIGSMLGIIMVLMLPLVKQRSQNLKWILGIVLIFYVGFQKRDFYFYSNHEQLQAIETFEKYIHENDYSIVDGLGLFPRHKKAELMYLGPHDTYGTDIQYNRLLGASVDTIVYTSRFFHIEPQVSQYLLNNYRSIGRGYWLRNDLETHQQFDTIMPGFQFGFQPFSRIDLLD